MVSPLKAESGGPDDERAWTQHLDALIQNPYSAAVPGPAVGDDPRDERMRAAHDALDQLAFGADPVGSSNATE